MGIPVDKFISNHAILMLKGIKNMKNDRWKKSENPWHLTKVILTASNQEAPQLVSWSFIMNLNSEFTWIYVKNNNWKLKICIFSPKWNENKNEKGEAKALVSYGVTHFTVKHILVKRIFDIHTKGKHRLYFVLFLAEFPQFSELHEWKRQIWWFDAFLNCCLQWLGKGSTNEFTIFCLVNT